VRALLADASPVPGPGPVLRVYGPSIRKEDKLALHRPEHGLLVLGQAPDLGCIARARVLLAPLRFGAGIKGKVAEAWARGTPVVTTPIGSEGMWTGPGVGSGSAPSGHVISELEMMPQAGPPMWPDIDEVDADGDNESNQGDWDNRAWGGLGLCETADELAEATARLLTSEAAWKQASAAGM